MKDTGTITADFFKNGVSDLIDEWAAKSNKTRHKAALEIFKAATGSDVSISFNDQNIMIGLPSSYLNACRDAGKDDHTIVRDCVANGILKLQAI